MDSILSCRNLTCLRENWRAGRSSIVRDLSADFLPGQLCGVCGADGCGKGLLMNLLGLLESPDSGSVRVFGTESRDMADVARTRNELFGYLFSQPALLPGLTVAENVAMPLFRIRGADPLPAKERTFEVLEFCGCEDSAETTAGELSMEQAAAASFARALVHKPKIIVAISPRGGETLLPIAARAALEWNLCILWAGEALPLSRFAHRMIEMEDGRLTGDLDFA